MGWVESPPKKDMLKSQPTVLQNVTLFVNKSVAGIIR